MKFKIVSLLASVALVLGFASPAAASALPDNVNPYATGPAEPSSANVDNNVPPPYAVQPQPQVPGLPGLSPSQRQWNKMNNTPWLPATRTPWFNNFVINGAINFDAFYNSDQSLLQGFQGTRSSYDSNIPYRDTGSNSAFAIEGLLNIDAGLNSWANGHLGLNYATSNQFQGISGTGDTTSNGYVPPTRYYPFPIDSTQGVQVEEAYFTVGNLDKMPVIVKGGLEYLPFGEYKRYSMVPSLTQQLTELRAPAIEVGYVQPNGPLYASGYVLSGINQDGDSNDDVANFGVTVGVARMDAPVRYSVTGYYLYNMADVGTLAQFLDEYNNRSYRHHVGAWGASGMIGTGPFTAVIKYVSAIGKFDPYDFAWQSTSSESDYTLVGASPSAAEVTGSYAFNIYQYKSRVSVSYQLSRQALATTDEYASLSLPLNRIAIDLTSMIFDNTLLGLEFNRDRAYQPEHGGTDDFGYGILARLSILI